MERNFANELEQILKRPDLPGKTLLLHSCCAPCSSYCLEYLRAYFRITVFYYNPNITREAEYHLRREEQRRLIAAMNAGTEVAAEERLLNRPDGGALYPITYREGAHEPDLFFKLARGLEHCEEGGERCRRCYELRLRETAARAEEWGMDYFTTTLTISPLKNAKVINEIGERIAAETGISFLAADFKKKNGYLRSIQLSGEYDLYRQNYCGCIYSQAVSL